MFRKRKAPCLTLIETKLDQSFLRNAFLFPQVLQPLALFFIVSKFCFRILCIDFFPLALHPGVIFLSVGRSVSQSVNHSLLLLLNATSMRWFFLLGLPLGAQVGLPQGAHWVGLPLGAHPHLFWKLHFVCMIIIISIGQSVGRSVLYCARWTDCGWGPVR